jgi:hypothetical protein
MASQPASQLSKHAPALGSPYCADPNCESCKELKEVHEAIERHEPIPIKKSA